MRRRNRDKGDSLTLFPFLAVLICTMGSLIVLLVIIVQQAKVNAKDVVRKRRVDAVPQLADDLPVATVEEVEDQLDEVAWRIEILETSRAETVAQLDQRRDTLAYLEDEIRQMRDRLDRTAAEAKQIQQLAESEQTDQLDADDQLARLREELQYAEEELEQARQEVDEREPSYALVAYDGSSGTRRRPIYVECREDRITLQPEGIVLTGDDFREPLTDDNALASALRAQREYLNDAAGSNNDPPYPLIVVRPDGAQAYAAARAAMKSWDTEFGYELVDDQVKLAFPDPDAALAAVTRQAVEESRARRKMLQQIAPARFGRSSLTASPSGGFQSRGGGPAASAGSRGNSAATRTGSQAASGIGTAGNTSGYGTSPESGGSDDPYAPRGGAGDAAALAGEIPGGGYGQSGALPGQAIAGNSGQAGTSRETGGTGRGGDGGSGASGANSATTARLGAPSFSEGNATNGAGQSTGASQTQAAANSATNRAASPGQAGGGSDSNRGQADGTGNSQRDSRLAESAAGSAGGNAGGAQSGQANGGSGSGGGSAAGNAGSGGGARSGSAFGATAPIAGTRGSNWALPGRGVGSTGITRPVNVTCFPDRLVVVPENRYRSDPIDLLVHDGIRPQIEPLVKEVNARIQRWGIAGNNMYWKPVLQVDVQVGADSRFEELALLLRESGIVVLRK